MATDYQALRAADVMTRSLVCVTPEQSLEDAETLLVEHRISGAPVVHQGRLVGVISIADLSRVKVLMSSLDGQVSDELEWSEHADGFQHAGAPDFQGFRQSLERLKVKDAMHDQVVACSPDAPLAEVAEKMVRMHTHRLVVVEDERAVGIISSLDLARLLAGLKPSSSRS